MPPRKTLKGVAGKDSRFGPHRLEVACEFVQNRVGSMDCDADLSVPFEAGSREVRRADEGNIAKDVYLGVELIAVEESYNDAGQCGSGFQRIRHRGIAKPDYKTDLARARFEQSCKGFHGCEERAG